MNHLDIQTPRQDAAQPAVVSDEFQLDMVDLGASYQAAEDVSACFRCYCGSGCLCGCVSA